MTSNEIGQSPHCGMVCPKSLKDKGFRSTIDALPAPIKAWKHIHK